MSLPPQDYATSLKGSDKQRYCEKIKLCGADPFVLRAGDCTTDLSWWPCVDEADINEFLVLRTRFLTRKQLKAKKGLESHNFVTSGWVREPWLKEVSTDTAIAITQVTFLLLSA